MEKMEADGKQIEQEKKSIQIHTDAHTHPCIVYKG